MTKLAMIVSISLLPFAASIRSLAAPATGAIKAAPAKAAAGVKLTPEEKVQFDKWQKYVNDDSASYAKYPLEMCGHKMPITIEPAMVPAFMKAGNELGLYCEEVRTKVSTICQNGEALKNNNKKKLAAAIQKITCKLGPVEDQATFNLVNGDLQATLGVKASDISDKLYKHLVAKGIAEGM